MVSGLRVPMLVKASICSSAKIITKKKAQGILSTNWFSYKDIFLKTILQFLKYYSVLSTALKNSNCKT